MNGDGIRVILIDDHTVLRDGLKLLLSLEPDLEVVGEAANGLAGIQTALDTRPDVVVTDVGLPDVDGVEVTRRLRELLPESRVLVLTVHDEDTYVFTLIQAGASGYLLKNAAGNDLVDAIRAVAAGKPWLQPEIAQRLMNVTSGASQQRPVEAEQDLIEPLTAREIVVLKLLAGAASNREIATNLTISTRTVETHLANIYGKLSVRGRTEAMLWAIHAGMAQG
ncbi:MAG TPA: response regulator transcription factor [Chloroflexota bacterium]